MAFSSIWQKTVVFVGGSLDAGTEEAGPLRGTGFVTDVKSADPEKTFLYVVTAAHVVRPLAKRFIRMSRPDGTVLDLDIPAEDWEFHPTEDVAVGQFSVSADDADLAVMPTKDFVGRAETRFDAGAGDQVFFPGLLALVESMGERRIPMIRTGTIGALNQKGIPIRLGDGTVVHVDGHLIDCRSFGGFSGSPCFVSFVSDINATPNLRLKSPVNSTHLLGMASGHFDLAASVLLPDQEENLKVPVAAGIAVITPARAILEVLESEELQEVRDKHDAASLSESPPD